MSTELKHTPGPWAWFGNANSKTLYLATTHSGRRYVMGFKRWGTQGAQPQFHPADRGMVDASELVQFEVGDRDVVGVEAARKNTSVYRFDVRGIDCADARLIAASPELLAVLVAIDEMWSSDGEGGRVNPTEARSPEAQAIWERVRAAIAKATGQ